MKKLTKKQLGLIAAIIMLGVGGTYFYDKNQSNIKATEAKDELKSSTQTLNDLDKKIQGLFDSKDSDYLIKGIKSKQVTDLQEEVDTATKIKKDKHLEKKDFTAYNQESFLVTTNMNKATNALKTLKDINGLYEQTQTSVAINGSEVKKDLAIVDDLSQKSIAKVKKDHFKEGATKTYDKTINELLTNAENQLNQIDKAKVEVEKVYKDEKVISIDNKLYDTAKVETDKIKNEKAKKALLDQLAKVKSDMDNKAKEEAENNKDSQASTQATTQNQTQEEAATTNPNVQSGSAEQQVATPPVTEGNTGYVAPPAAGVNTDYVAPTVPEETTQPPVAGTGGMNQDQLDQSEREQTDPTKDPNSPWFNK